MRRQPRARGPLPVVINVKRGNGSTEKARPRFASALDFSAGGVKAKCGEPCVAGQTVEVMVVATDPPQRFNHVGQVRWVREVTPGTTWVMGIQFTETPATVLPEWRAFVNAHLTAADRHAVDDLFAAKAGWGDVPDLAR